MRNPFIILAVFLLPFCVQAQNTSNKEFAIGASFGMGGAKVTFNPKVQTSMLLSSQFGITGRWVTEKNLGLILEVNYSQQGWAENFEPSDPTLPTPDFEYSRRINYIDVPFLTHIYFGNNRFRFFFNLGPQIGFMLSESTTENVIGKEDQLHFPNTGNQYATVREKPVETKFAWGLCGGPGIELRTGAGIFQLEGRYYYGLGDLFKNNLGQDFTKSSSQIMFAKLTYLIPFRR